MTTGLGRPEPSGPPAASSAATVPKFRDVPAPKNSSVTRQIAMRRTLISETSLSDAIFVQFCQQMRKARTPLTRRLIIVGGEHPPVKSLPHSPGPPACWNTLQRSELFPTSPTAARFREPLGRLGIFVLQAEAWE